MIKWWGGRNPAHRRGDACGWSVLLGSFRRQLSLRGCPAHMWANVGIVPCCGIKCVVVWVWVCLRSVQSDPHMVLASGQVFVCFRPRPASFHVNFGFHSFSGSCSVSSGTGLGPRPTTSDRPDAKCDMTTMLRPQTGTMFVPAEMNQQRNSKERPREEGGVTNRGVSGCTKNKQKHL